MGGADPEEPAPCDPPFVWIGEGRSTLPVLIAVPHAGRIYPEGMREAARVPLARLEALEDRHADALIADAVAAGARAIVATRARAWIDLNRAETDIDSEMIEPRPMPSSRRESVKVLGGLGLIPRRIAGAGEIWRGPIAAQQLARRIADDHRPYHVALAAALRRVRARFGVAVLIDCHSMPSLGGGDPARIVIGDRHGQSARRGIVAAALAEAQASGLRCARNAPYAGGYTLERHGRPDEHVHALQIEFDRTLYLDAAQRAPTARIATVAALLERIVRAVADEALGPPHAIAAE